MPLSLVKSIHLTRVHGWKGSAGWGFPLAVAVVSREPARSPFSAVIYKIILKGLGMDGLAGV